MPISPVARSTVSSVSSPACGTRYASRPDRFARPASWRALAITSAATLLVGGRSEMVHRPSRSIRIGTGSYRSRSRFAITAAADASDTSCSLERPP